MKQNAVKEYEYALRSVYICGLVRKKMNEQVLSETLINKFG